MSYTYTYKILCQLCLNKTRKRKRFCPWSHIRSSYLCRQRVERMITFIFSSLEASESRFIPRQADKKKSLFFLELLEDESLSKEENLFFYLSCSVEYFLFTQLITSYLQIHFHFTYDIIIMLIMFTNYIIIVIITILLYICILILNPRVDIPHFRNTSCS